MSLITRILKEAKNVIATYFFSQEQLLSSDIQEILENPEDRKKYFEAIDQLKDSTKDVKEVNLELSNHKKITLSLNH
ncbi:MAG: hypothetical protein ACJLTB_17515 [Algoriphagus aquaeductus]|jgi:hypothetical protein|uniref:hypothetical protein n=1 Tax=Algoriphagus aquaeductus TaxID=475299 RepID=UPI00387A295C